MATTVDARGLSCPQPVMMTLQGIKTSGENSLLVLVDTETSKENVSRAAASQGWKVQGIEENGEEFHITITKE